MSVKLYNNNKILLLQLIKVVMKSRWERNIFQCWYLISMN